MEEATTDSGGRIKRKTRPCDVSVRRIVDSRFTRQSIRASAGQIGPSPIFIVKLATSMALLSFGFCQNKTRKPTNCGMKAIDAPDEFSSNILISNPSIICGCICHYCVHHAVLRTS